jgi:hypothetical protein
MEPKRSAGLDEISQQFSLSGEYREREGAMKG